MPPGWPVSHGGVMNSTPAPRRQSTAISHEGDPAGHLTFWMGSDWAGEARWAGDGYSVEARSGHRFHSESLAAVEGALDALYWTTRDLANRKGRPS